MVGFQPPNLRIGKSGRLCYTFVCVSYTEMCNTNSHLCRWLELVRLTSAENLIGTTIKEFSLSFGLLCWRFCNSVLSILTQFLSITSEHVMMDGCRSKLVNVALGMPHGIVSGSVIVPPVHLGSFSDSGEQP